MRTAGRRVIVHRHYHYHAARPAPPELRTRRSATLLADTFAPAELPAADKPAPSITPRKPYYRSKPCPPGMWGRRRWQAMCHLEAAWERTRPWAIWVANALLRVVDFVLTRITIGFLFRPLGGM